MVINTNSWSNTESACALKITLFSRLSYADLQPRPSFLSQLCFSVVSEQLSAMCLLAKFVCLETAIFNFKSIFSTVPLSHLFLLTILIADNHKMNFCIEVEKNTENQYLKPKKRWIWPRDRPSYPAGFPEAVLWRRDALSVWWGRGKILNTAKNMTNAIYSL